MKRILFFSCLALVFLSGIVAYHYFTFNDHKLHVVFCDVGQGDAILIRTPNNKHILIDGGPDKSVLDCLSRHMPFWERTLDLVILTHPHSDHFLGFYHVLDRYSVLSFATEKLSNKTDGFQALLQMIEEKRIQQRVVYAGDHWQVGDVSLAIAAPTKEFLEQTSPEGTIGESREFASLITHLSFGEFDLVLTGDSQAGGLTDATGSIGKDIDVLQVPHHGSASGLDEHILNELNPKLAVISIGKNRYGHPTKKTLDLLEAKGIKVVRTDQIGDVEIVSDGVDE